MKKYFVSIALIITLLLGSFGFMTGCLEGETPGASAVFDRLHLRGNIMVWDGDSYVLVRLPTTSDTLVGRATTDTLTNKTLTSPTMTTPTLNGDIVFGNIASGNSTIRSGQSNRLITHGLGSAPVLILLTWGEDTDGGGGELYADNVSSTYFDANSVNSTSSELTFYWFASTFNW